MPKTIKDPDTGEEMEYYSADEVEQRSREAVEEKQGQWDEEKLKLEDKLSDVEDQLKVEKEKDKNFNRLRRKQARDNGEEEPEDIKSPKVKELEDQVKDLSGKIDKVVTAPLEEIKDTFVDSKIGVDQKARDLFDHYYKKTSVGAETKKEVESALKEALLLYENAGGKVNQDSRMVRTGGYPSFEGDDDGGSTRADSAENQQMARALGVSQKDRDTYGNGKAGRMTLIKPRE